MAENVRCADCGMLAVRDSYRQDEVREAVDRCRTNGTYMAANGTVSGARLFCYAHARDELHSASGAPLVQLLLEPFDCANFQRWHRGKTPKEHEEMVFLLQVERQTEQARSENSRWQKQVEALAETRHQELRRDQEQFQDAQHKHNWRMAWFAAVVSLGAAVIGGVAGAWLAWLLSARR